MSNSLLYSFLRSPSDVPTESSNEVVAVDGPGAEEWKFVDAGHSSCMLSGLLELKRTKSLCDVSLQVGEDEYPAHKCVLSAASPYFKAMFTCNLSESKLDSVALNGMESPIVELLINYAYTSTISITKMNVQSLLSASNLLEMLSVREACCQFLGRHMDETNVLGIQNYAEAHACMDLFNQAKAYALKHFQDLIAGDEFVNMSHVQLTDIISNDDLDVEKEEIVFLWCTQMV
ncbi:KLHL20 [Lepeophtheirus salmonis]|uniref:KLHL20 n=1 Tax=Lepeophtheirus salmonis TaxID=72036 RepID=A0A7R8CBN9_LEPSM|nr:KLHL20 [Lepeophtheirus salmonis]CAF2755004.1 KLHL20 [Lepeophtheirus salmonis]